MKIVGICQVPSLAQCGQGVSGFANRMRGLDIHGPTNHALPLADSKLATDARHSSDCARARFSTPASYRAAACATAIHKPRNSQRAKMIVPSMNNKRRIVLQTGRETVGVFMIF